MFGKNDFAVYGDKDQMLQEISKLVDACRTNENYWARVVFSNTSMMHDIIRNNIIYGVSVNINGQREQLINVVNDNHTECISFRSSQFVYDSAADSLWIRLNNESILEFLSVTDRREFFSSNSNSNLICIGENGEVLENLVDLSYTIFSDFYKFKSMTESDNDSNPDFKLLEQYLDELTKEGRRFYG